MPRKVKYSIDGVEYESDMSDRPDRSGRGNNVRGYVAQIEAQPSEEVVFDYRDLADLYRPANRSECTDGEDPGSTYTCDDTGRWPSHPEIEQMAHPIDLTGSVLVPNGDSYDDYYHTEDGLNFNVSYIAQHLDWFILPEEGEHEQRIDLQDFELNPDTMHYRSADGTRSYSLEYVREHPERFIIPGL